MYVHHTSMPCFAHTYSTFLAILPERSGDGIMQTGNPQAQNESQPLGFETWGSLVLLTNTSASQHAKLPSFVKMLSGKYKFSRLARIYTDH